MPEVLVRGEAQEIALAELQAVRAHVTDPGYAAELAGLGAAVAAGEVADEDAAALGKVLALALQAGRIRALYGPGGEQATLRLYRRLPEGAAAAASASEVSDALEALKGRELDSISLRTVGPGSFALELSAGGAELSVRLDRQGARLASVVL